jgi:predicted Zn finger-like uncharacterized protein
MVVTCEKCHTKFVLDEKRIKEARTKVRCSRCQHLFWVEREEEPPDTAPGDTSPQEAELPEEEVAATGAGAAAPPPLAVETEAFDEGETGQETETRMEVEKAARSKPSIIFTTPPKRSLWPWIIILMGGLLGGVLLGGAIMWFGGYGWVARHLQGRGPALAPPAKVSESAKVVAAPLPAPPAAVEDLKDLEIINQEERYRGLVNSKGGQLLLIQGKVKNTSQQFRGPVKIKAMLTDPGQKIVKEREFYAGTVIFDDELQSLDPEEIIRWLDTPGGRAQKQILDPGESQSFMVVFFHAPQNLSGYGYKLQVVKGPVAPSQSSNK